jgi:hypothetical protein
MLSRRLAKGATLRQIELDQVEKHMERKFVEFSQVRFGCNSQIWRVSIQVTHRLEIVGEFSRNVVLKGSRTNVPLCPLQWTVKFVSFSGGRGWWRLLGDGDSVQFCRNMTQSQQGVDRILCFDDSERIVEKCREQCLLTIVTKVFVHGKSKSV